MSKPHPAGSGPHWKSAVSVVEDAAIYVRGYDLTQVMGSLPFSAATFLLIRGVLPTPSQARTFDAVLTSILDYSLQKPATTAARYNVSSNPHMVPGLATAVLGVGDYAIAPEHTGRFIAETYRRFKESGEVAGSFAEKLIAEMREKNERVPGLGHPIFRKVDPRAERLRVIATEAGVWGDVCDWYMAVHRAFSKTGHADIVINDVGMVAAILSELGFTPPEMTGVTVISTLPGTIAHISEELASNIRLRKVPDEDVEYDRSKRDLQSDLALAGW